MPEREGPDSERRNRLAWERMQARKFIWQDGDVMITPLPKKAFRKEPPHPHRGEDRPGPGRG